MRLVRIALAPLLLAALACADGPTGSSGGDSQTNPTRVSVSIADFRFSPATVNIRVGTEVRWINTGPSSHTTTSEGGLWNSGTISGGGGGGYGSGGAGGSYSRTFDQVGEFQYNCSIHPSMRGKVVVSE